MSKKSNGKDSYTILYAIRKEDVGHYGIKKEKVIYRHGVPMLMVPTENAVVYEECCKVLDNDRKQNARQAKCIVISEFGNYARCAGNCKTCTENVKKTVVFFDDLNKEERKLLCTEDPSYERFEYSHTFDEVMKKLAEIKPKYAEYIIRFCRNHETIEKIAKSEHKAKSTINEQLMYASKLAKKIFEGEL